MATQTIEVKGLPEGWKAKEFRLGEINEPYFDPATKSICRLLLGSTVGVLIVEKIQPRRIVLDLTQHEYSLLLKIPVEQRLFDDPVMFDLIRKIKSEEVKETDIPLTNAEHNVKMSVSQGDGDEPKLELSVDELKTWYYAKNQESLKNVLDKVYGFIKDK